MNFDITDIIEYTDKYGKTHTCRVESFLKKVYLPEPKDYPVESFADEIVNEILQESYTKYGSTARGQASQLTDVIN